MTEAEIVPTSRQPALPHNGHPGGGSSRTTNLHNTYGCLEPIEIGPLDALLDDIHRTYAHIMWLENYIATHLSTHDPFTQAEFDIQREQERSLAGRPSNTQTNNLNVVGSTKWQLEMQRKRQTNTQRARPGTHPAISQLLNERRHLADISTKAINLGVKLDSIDYSRKQADLIVTAMGKFALSQGLNPADKQTADAIVIALEQVLAEHTEQPI